MSIRSQYLVLGAVVALGCSSVAMANMTGVVYGQGNTIPASQNSAHARAIAACSSYGGLQSISYKQPNYQDPVWTTPATYVCNI